MKVLLLAYQDDPKVGGSLRVAEFLGRGLRRLGVSAEIAFPYGSPGPIGSKGDVPTHYLGMEGSREVTSWLKLRRLVDDVKPDILHFSNPLTWGQLVTAGQTDGRVVHVHGRLYDGGEEKPGTHLDWKKKATWALQRAFADRVVCITHGARKSLLDHDLAEPDEAVVVHNAIDVDWFQNRPDEGHARRQLGLPEDAHLVGMVSRIHLAKGCDDLVRLLTHLPDDWHAVLTSDGPHKKDVRSLARDLGVKDRLWFTGVVDDVRPVYSALDAFAFLSRYEPFGLMIAEAMASEVPVFGLESLGEYDEAENPLVTPGTTTFLERTKRTEDIVPAQAKVLDALAEEIDEVREGSKALGAQVARARRHVEEKFDVEHQAERALAVYRDILGDA